MNATITLAFNQSTYEQVDPSSVTVLCEFGELSNYNQMRFLRMSLEKIVDIMNRVTYQNGLTMGEKK